MIKVIFIGAHSRSGSTLVERMLGQLPGVIAVGELRHIWQRGILENQLCGCGVPFRECAVWADVFRHRLCFEADFNAAVQVQQEVDRLRNFPRIAYKQLQGARLENLISEYKKYIKHLYEAIADTTGAHTIIDSSKSPTYGIVLSQLRDIDLRVIHLVRDSRAVAYSRMRRKIRPEIHWKEERMAITCAGKTALEWTITNYALGLLKKRANYMFLKYEKFLSDPKAGLVSVSAFSELGSPDLSFIKERNVVLQPNHTVSGNPVRFTSGTIKLNEDSEWNHKLSKKDRTTLYSLTWPLLMKYRYISGAGHNRYG